MLAQLDTLDIKSLMSGVEDFVGVFPSDKLPPYISPTSAIKMIVNIDPSTMEGSHWVAIYRQPHTRIGYYFDTYGLPPPPRIHHWLAANCVHWRNFEKRIQSFNDRVSCGYICMEFLKKL